MSNQNSTISPAELGAQFQKFAIKQNGSEVALLAASQKSVSSANQFAQSMQSSAKQLEGWSIAAGCFMALGAALSMVGLIISPSAILSIARAGTAVGSATTGLGEGVMQSRVSTDNAAAKSMMSNGQQNAKGAQTLEKSNQQIMRTAANEYMVNAVVVQAG